MNEVLYFRTPRRTHRKGLSLALCDRFQLERLPESSKNCAFLKNDAMLIAIRKKMIDVVYLDGSWDLKMKRDVKKILYGQA